MVYFRFKNMKQSEIIKFYSRRDVASFIAKSSENREVAVQLQGGRYGRRPQIIQFPNDVISLAREGATSFHISQEKWQDPMKISDTLTKKEFEDLRIGWDFIIDIDCPDFKISTIGAEAIIEFLKKYGICPQIKFSGNKGWHICIPAEAFPKSMKNLFPEMSNTLITYIISESIEIFIDKLKKINFNFQDFFEKNKIKPEQFYSESNKQNLTKLFGLDVQLASPRHLIRAPYSVNEKSGLVSVVIDVDEVFNFKKEFAEPKNIKDINPNFFKKDNYSETDCILLVTEAKDWAFKEKKSQKSSVPSESRKFVEFKEKVPEEFFPPCIIHILKGLTDGKKRALFILLNFLQQEPSLM